MSKESHYRAEMIDETLDIGDRPSQGTVLAEFESTTGQKLCAFEADRSPGSASVMVRSRVRRV